MLVPKELEKAAMFYESRQAPSEYYEEKMVNKKWVYLTTVGLFFSWIADNCPTVRKKPKDDQITLDKTSII